MVILGRYLFYLAALILESVSSLSHNRDLNYYDGSRGRMDRNYEIHEEFFQRNNRPKRTLRGPNLWEKSSESQGVSCPTRLRENYMGTPGESDGMKEVVHIPCPKRKSSGAKVVAAFKGKSTKCNARKSHDGNRGARELVKNTRGNDLNKAVKQTAQWFILPAQDRAQKPNQGYMDHSFNSSINTDLACWNRNQPLLNSNLGVPTLNQPTIWKNCKGAKDELRKPNYIKSAQLAPQSADSKLKPIMQYPQSYVDGPQRLKETVLLDRGQQPPAPTNQGYFNIGPSRNLQEVPNQGPYPKKDRLPQNPYEGNRLLMNSYNITHDGQHHYGPQNQPSNIFDPLNPSDRIAYPNPQAQMNPSFFQSRVTPANGVGVQQYSYNLLYNVTLPSETAKMFQNINETRNGPWSPGALEADIPPGYPHQPKLPKTTTRSFDAVNIKDLPKVDQKNPSSNSQFGYPKYDKGQQYQPGPNTHYESWKYRDGSNSQQQLNSNLARPDPPARSFEKLGVTPSLEKTSQPFKVFGKLKKEESKIKLPKPAKIPASNAHARIPADAQGGPAASFGGTLMSNGKPDESAPLLSQPELGLNLPNSQNRNEAARFNAEVNTNYKAAIPIGKTSQNRSASLNERVRQEYHNFPGDMSHILDPPVNTDANFYTNKAHKIASKLVSSKDVTYVPFRGVPPARNDEAFYDKNLNFLGKIDRPPLVNIKKHKWSKLNGRGNAGRIHADYPVGFYSEPTDFHSKPSAKGLGPKYVKRHSRKFYPNQLNRQRLNPHSRIKV